MKRKIVNALKLLFTPVALAFLVYFAWISRDELASLISNASLTRLLLAAVVWAALHFLSPVFAAVVFRGCGAMVSWKQAFATHATCPVEYGIRLVGSWITGLKAWKRDR